MKMSQYDLHQIARMSFDEDHAAQRVVLAGLDNIVIEPKIDLQALESKLEALSVKEPAKLEKIEVPTIVKEIEIVEVPKIIIQEKQVPVDRVVIQEKLVPVEQQKIITQEVIKTIEIPVIVKEIEYKEVKIPVITEQLNNDKILKLFQMIQSVAVVGILIKMLLK